MIDLIGINQQLMTLMIPELILWLLVQRIGSGFKFRFSTVSGYPGLRPFANSSSVGVVAFVVYLFSPNFLERILGSGVSQWLTSLGWVKLILITTILVPFNLIFIINHLLGKKLDKNTVFLCLIAGASILVFSYI